MSDDKKVIFSMSGLTKTYQSAQTPVLKNIYLSFFYGAKIGILGLNGSGKSTTPKWYLPLLDSFCPPLDSSQLSHTGKVSPLVASYRGRDFFLFVRCCLKSSNI